MGANLILYHGVLLTEDMACPDHGPEGAGEGCEACLVAGAYADPSGCVGDDE